MLSSPQILSVRQIAAAARNAKDGSELGRSRHKGITVLFNGPNGTGKTMAAEALARELGVDLLRADLSTIVSKYVGETEKNLQSIFETAESRGSILFFDEADSLFGRRSEVKDSHDRYANSEIDYLLKCMNAYRGIAILSTNSNEPMEALVDRLQFVAQFPFC